MEDHEDKMSNYALHSRLEKLEKILLRAGFITWCLRQLISYF